MRVLGLLAKAFIMMAVAMLMAGFMLISPAIAVGRDSFSPSVPPTTKHQSPHIMKSHFAAPQVAATNGQDLLIYNGGPVMKKSVSYAFNTTSGAIAWSYTTPTGATIDTRPAVVKGVVYVSADDGAIYALNATSGAFLWNSKPGGGISHSSPAIVKGILYIGSTDNSLYALNSTTGATLWSYATGNEVVSSPLVNNGNVYIGSWDSYLAIPHWRRRRIIARRVIHKLLGT